MAAKKQALTLESPLELNEIAGHGIQAELSAGTVLAGNYKLMKKFEVDVPENIQSSYGTQVLMDICLFLTRSNLSLQTR